MFSSRGRTDSSSITLGSSEALGAAFPAFACPFAFGRIGMPFCLGGLFTSVFSVLADDAAVGLLILSRKLLSTGAAGFLVVFCDVLDSGRPAREDLGVGRADAVFGGARLAAAGLAVFVADSNRAREAAVGAVKREEMSIGLVVSLGFGFGAVEVDACFSAAAVRATEAAVGAVREVLTGLVGALAEVVEERGFLGGLIGDLTVLEDAFGALVEMEAGFAASALDAVGFVSFLKSSATGGNASPPLTACSLTGSAGFISAGSSCSPVTGLSGFSGALSTFGAAAVDAPMSFALSSSAGVSTACSGMSSATLDCLPRLSASVATVSLIKLSASPL